MIGDARKLFRRSAESAAGAVTGERGFDPAASAGLFDSPISRIGIMGTDGTVSSGVYARACEAVGVEAVVPSPERQRDVMALIYDDVKAGRDPHLYRFERALEELVERGCDRVILACTELSVLKRYREMPPLVLDAMDVLVRESIVRSGAVFRA